MKSLIIIRNYNIIYNIIINHNFDININTTTIVNEHVEKHGILRTMPKERASPEGILPRHTEWHIVKGESKTSALPAKTR